MTEVNASPRKIAPLNLIFTDADIERLYRRFYHHWTKCKHTDDHFVVDGVDVYSFYGSRKQRHFYSLGEDTLNYYACLAVSDDRGFLSERVKRYYQALVHTDFEFSRKHRGFARAVIFDVMFKSYIDSLLITDHEQTELGFGMWQNLVADAFEQNKQAVAYINDERKLICPLTRENVRGNRNWLSRVLFGSAYKYEDRGIFILKKALNSVLKNTPRVEIVSIEDFLEYGTQR